MIQNSMRFLVAAGKNDDTGDSLEICQIPANTKHLYDICTTSAQRLRRWSNIVQMSYKCFVHTGSICEDEVKITRGQTGSYRVRQGHTGSDKGNRTPAIAFSDKHFFEQLSK